jgi:hypothetical protein
MKKGTNVEDKSYIPCLYLPHVNKSAKLMLYFHGNAEDVGLSTDLLIFMRD